MRIVTTPMCEKILEFAGIAEYKINKNPDKEEGDLAILLSESKVKMNSLSIKLNTFSQIKESIIEVSKLKNNELRINELSNATSISEENIDKIFEKYPLANGWISNKKENMREKNSKIRVKVYSKFIKDIVEDMGFNVIDTNDSSSDFDYIVFPDYMDLVDVNVNKNGNHFISIPTHNNISKDPIKRAELRYSILNDLK